MRQSRQKVGLSSIEPCSRQSAAGGVSMNQLAMALLLLVLH